MHVDIYILFVFCCVFAPTASRASPVVRCSLRTNTSSGHVRVERTTYPRSAREEESILKLNSVARFSSSRNSSSSSSSDAADRWNVHSNDLSEGWRRCSDIHRHDCACFFQQSLQVDWRSAANTKKYASYDHGQHQISDSIGGARTQQ